MCDLKQMVLQRSRGQLTALIWAQYRIFGRIWSRKSKQWSSHQTTWNEQLFVFGTLFHSLMSKNYIWQCLQEFINALDCTDLPLNTNYVSFKKILSVRILCSMHWICKYTSYNMNIYITYNKPSHFLYTLTVANRKFNASTAQNCLKFRVLPSLVISKHCLVLFCARFPLSTGIWAKLYAED